MTEQEKAVARCFIDRRYIYTSPKVGSASLNVSSDVTNAIYIKCIKLDLNQIPFMSNTWHAVYSKVLRAFGL